jgi:hypothetical protein
VLAFPGIDLTLEGFTIPHLRLIGVNVTKFQRRESLVWLGLDHELQHTALSIVSPYLRYTKYRTANFYVLIFDTFNEGGEKIEVPLRRNLSGNKLEIHWDFLYQLKEGSRLTEEICAVRSSIFKTQERRSIEPEALGRILSYYKGAYEERIPGFHRAYEAFDLIDMTLGDTIAKAIVFCSLSTGNPDTAFWDIIWGMCALEPSVPTNNIVWNLSREMTSFLANLSREETYDYFSHFLDSLDKDDLRYGRKALRNHIATIEQKFASSIQDEWHDFYNFFLNGSPDTLLFSEYTQKGLLLHGEDYNEVIYGDVYIFFESVLQQLVTGKGLVCPFWLHGLHGPDNVDDCCRSENKELLEKVWSCTSHNCSYNWKRMGCLAYDGGTH